MKKKTIQTILVTFLTIIITVFAVLPFYVMIMMSTHNSIGIVTKNVLLPGKYLIHNLKLLIASKQWIFYGNSLFISVTATVLSVIVCSLTGYGLSKHNFKGKNALITVILMTMMLPAQLSLIGYVKQMAMIGLIGSFAPLIIIFIANPFAAYWMKTYIDSSVPNEILESARIDGASEFRIYYKIVIPFISSALITVAMLVFLGSWNMYLLPLLTLNDAAKYTIPLGINYLDPNENTIDFGSRATALAASTIPLLIIFAIGSKYFIRGLTSGGIKG